VELHVAHLFQNHGKGAVKVGLLLYFRWVPCGIILTLFLLFHQAYCGNTTKTEAIKLFIAGTLEFCISGTVIAVHLLFLLNQCLSACMQTNLKYWILYYFQMKIVLHVIIYYLAVLFGHLSTVEGDGQT